ncbi:MAG TPA: hypothetical protein P5081_15780 [Phycisphaerae bacterium]|nr:hypothetical protein [Phycisphaerae bacterium]HRW54331.1 hypothetical protein [Phycisphaerae bacterium]
MTDRFHVVVTTPQPPTRGVIEHVAGVTGLPAYDARLKLRSFAPRSIAFRQNAAEALDLAERLTFPDLRRVVFCERDLPPVAPFAAFRMGRIAQGFVFEDKRGNRRTLRHTEVALVVIGRKTTQQTATSIEYSACNYEPGPRGSRSPVTVSQVRRRSKRHARLVTFFPADDSVAPIRIVTDVFDFSCLGRHRGHSDHENSLKLAEMIDAAIEGLDADRRLLETSIEATTIPHNHRTFADDEHAASCLVYWDRLAVQAPNGLINRTSPLPRTAP